MNRTFAVFLGYIGLGYLFECVRDELSLYYDEKLDNTMRLLEDANEKIKREKIGEETNREELGYLSED